MPCSTLILYPRMRQTYRCSCKALSYCICILACGKQVFRLYTAFESLLMALQGSCSSRLSMLPTRTQRGKIRLMATEKVSGAELAATSGGPRGPGLGLPRSFSRCLQILHMMGARDCTRAVKPARDSGLCTALQKGTRWRSNLTTASACSADLIQQSQGGESAWCPHLHGHGLGVV